MKVERPPSLVTFVTQPQRPPLSEQCYHTTISRDEHTGDLQDLP